MPKQLIFGKWTVTDWRFYQRLCSTPPDADRQEQPNQGVFKVRRRLRGVDRGNVVNRFRTAGALPHRPRHGTASPRINTQRVIIGMFLAR